MIVLLERIITDTLLILKFPRCLMTFLFIIYLLLTNNRQSTVYRMYQIKIYWLLFMLWL